MAGNQYKEAIQVIQDEIDRLKKAYADPNLNQSAQLDAWKLCQYMAGILAKIQAVP